MGFPRRRLVLAISAAIVPAVPALAQHLPMAVAAESAASAAAKVAAQRDAFAKASDTERRAAGLALINTVADQFANLPAKARQEADYRFWVGVADDEASRRVLVDRMRKVADDFARTGDVDAELYFRDWMTFGLSQDMLLGHARLLHRRAAETGRLGGSAGENARTYMGDVGRELNDSGRHPETLQALDDSFAELDAAGLRQQSSGLLRLYAETLTLARRDVQADATFAELIALLETHKQSRSRDREIELTHNQASYYRNIVRRFAAAETPGRTAAAMAETLLGRTEIATQKARYNFALSLLGQGKAAESLPYFEEALPLQLAAEKGWSGDRTDTIILLTTLARARAGVADYTSGALDAAVEAALRLRAQQTARLAGGGQTDPAVAALARAVAQGERRDPLSGAFDMVLLAGWSAREARGDAMDAAFLAAQDLTLTDAGSAINEAAARDIAGAGALGEMVRNRQDAAALVVSLTGAYRQSSLGSDEARTSALRVRLDSAAGKLAEFDRQVARDFPDYGALVAPHAVDIASLQAWLAPDEAVLMILPSEGSQFIFAISAQSARWHRADGSAAEVARLVARLKCRIDEATCSVADFDAAMAAEGRGEISPIDARYPRFDRGAAHQLYSLLIAPVADALPQKGRVYTVASGAIAGLPLAALVASPPGGDPESGELTDLASTDWLAKHFAFVTLPSVSALALAQRGRDPAADAAGRPQLVAYGAPTLTGSGQAAARGGGSGRRRGGIGVRGADLTGVMGDKTMASVDKLRRLDPLPGTITELTALARAIAKGGGVRLGKAATETAVKADTDLPRAAAVVFATHGLLPGEMGVGSEPGLVLTPPAIGTARDDGLLTASEAAALTLTARWVVLSACNTANPGGAGAGSSGESLSSLARSFLYAGADNLLASHWRVADDATAALTVEALANRTETPARALAGAMEAVRTGKRANGSALAEWAPHWAHPASWAPFTLVTNRDR